MSIRPIKRLSQASPTIEGAGVHLRRAFGFGDTSDSIPSCSSTTSATTGPEDYLAGFPWHPHRGIETITYVLAGNVEHGDSLGNQGSLGAGDVQWMTAGPRHRPSGDAAGRRAGPDARLPALGQSPLLAQDDRAALPGRQSGRHSRGHRRRRHQGPHHLRQLLGRDRPGRRHRRRAELHRHLGAAGQAEDPAGRDHPPRLRLRLRRLREVLPTPRRRAASAPKTSTAPIVPPAPRKPATARSSSSTAATRSPCRPASRASASSSSPASRSRSRSPGTARSS